MRGTAKERGSAVPRHDFDSLPISADVEVRCARYAELPALADMARCFVPGVQLSEVELARYFTFDPDSLLTFSRRGKLLGGMAFLFLNERGHDALLLDEISLTQPDMRLLAGNDEEVSAIYIWAIAATGRGIAGLGNSAAHLRTPRFARADCFAQPSTVAGRDILIATGFKQTPSFQPDLWCYERPWNRLPLILPAPSVAPGGFAHARP